MIRPTGRPRIRWKRHVKAVAESLRPPQAWYREMWHELRELMEGLMDWRETARSVWLELIDKDTIPRYRVVDLDKLERALEDLKIEATALKYRWHEQEQRNAALEGLHEVERKVIGALR